MLAEFISGAVVVMLMMGLMIFGAANRQSQDRQSPALSDDVPVYDDRRERNQSSNSTQPRLDRSKVSVQTGQDRSRPIELLRERLKAISFYHPGCSFKVDDRGTHLTIRKMRTEGQVQRTVASIRTNKKILDDVVRMTEQQFIVRLVRLLNKRGFELKEVGNAQT